VSWLWLLFENDDLGGEVLFDVDDNDDADGGEKEAADEG